QRSADGGAVADERAHRLDDVELGHLFAGLDLGIHADNGGTDHELEEEQADAAHDEGDPEDALAKQGVGSVIDEDGQQGTGDEVGDHGTGAAEGGQLRTLDRVVGNQGHHGAVRHVGHGVESVPDNVTGDEQDR